MFCAGCFTVNLNPFEMDNQPAMLIAPTVDSLVLHEPSIHDAVHDRVKLCLLIWFKQLEQPGLVIQGERDVLELVLLQVRHGSPDWETVCRTRPCQLTAVVTVGTTSISKILQHTAVRHRGLLSLALCVGRRMRGGVNLELPGDERYPSLAAVAVDPHLMERTTDGFDNTSVRPIRRTLVRHTHFIIYVERHDSEPSLGHVGR